MPANRKHTIEGVLFDWDGTLINSYDADTSAYLAMFKEMGIAWGIEELEKHYSPNWYEVYRAAGLPRKRWNWPGVGSPPWRPPPGCRGPPLRPGFASCKVKRTGRCQGRASVGREAAGSIWWKPIQAC